MKLLEKFELNTEGTDFFVGDIHGMYDNLMYEMDSVSFNFDTDRLFSVGDLIDRGPNSELSLELVKEPWFFAVRGNHEDFMVNRDMSKYWYQNGGQWAYTDKGQAREDIEDFRNIVSIMPIAMEVSTKFGTIGVIHTDPPDNWSWLDVSFTEKYLWGRRRVRGNRQSIVEGIDKVVIGHTPIRNPKLYGNVLAIDTGAYLQEEGDDKAYLTIMSAKEVFNFGSGSGINRVSKA